PKADAAQDRRAAAGKRAEIGPLRKRVSQAETQIARLMRELEKIDAALADGDLFAREPAKAATLAKARSDTASALAAAEEEWLAASAAVETA
ncbi:MAG: ABC transporter ATP-binding protein, partial [Pseudolabrys sp.]